MAAKLKSKNAAGFFFWLRWIVLAIAGFLGPVLYWNWLFFEKWALSFREPRAALGWSIAVFGTWFVILIPLMKKKETVMGHMDREDRSTMTWWLVWIALTIGSFFLAVWFWTPVVAARFGSIRNSQASLFWIIAVFGSWLAALTPLMILMYMKVVRSYEQAQLRRERGRDPFEEKVKIRAVYIEESKRRIPKFLEKKLASIPSTIKNGRLVTVILKDGRKIEHVFIAGRKEILGIYDQAELPFDPAEIADLEPEDLTHPPDLTEKVWLRLDGNA